jgi:hypothetical protein
MTALSEFGLTRLHLGLEGEYNLSGNVIFMFLLYKPKETAVRIAELQSMFEPNTSEAGGLYRCASLYGVT